MAATSMKDRIRKNYDYLIRELQVSNYLNYLFQEQVLSSDELDDLRSIQGRKHQAERFVDTIMRKPEEKLKKLFDKVNTDDGQPHIYKKIFGKSKQDSEQRASQGELGNTMTASSCSGTVDAQWEEIVIPRLPEVISALQPRLQLLLDRLRAVKLLTQTEYDQLLEVPEQTRSRKLLNTILPPKPGSFTKFCEVLRSEKTQRHVVTDLLQETERSRPTSEVQKPQSSTSENYLT
jgi:hypothetical protein